MVEAVLHDNGMDNETDFSSYSNNLIEPKSSNLVTEAVILAGGLGTRLFPLTKSKPKPLLNIGNQSMIDWNISLLSSNGVSRVIIAVDYLGEQIQNHIKNYSSKMYPEMEIVVPRLESHGTADALRVVSNYVKSKNFFVTMADIVTNINLEKLASFHVKKNGIATISLKELESNPNYFGLTVINDQSKVLNYLEKPSPYEMYLTYMVLNNNQHFKFQPNLINSGIYCFKQDILDILNDFEYLNDFGHDVFPFLINRKKGLYGFKGDEEYFWEDCGQFDSLLKTNVEVLERKTMPYYPKGKELDGSWFLDTCFSNNVSIKKPVAIGKDVKIACGTLIHLSSINDCCTIGKNSKIEKSLIWEHATIGDDVKVLDSIISNNVTIGNNSIIENGSIIPEGLVIPPNSHIRSGRLMIE